MYPTLFRLGPLTLHSYGLMMALGFLSALWIWGRLSRHTGYSADLLSTLLFWMLISGLLGARLLHVLQYWEDFAANPVSILRIDQGGLVFFGGAIGAGLALVCFARRHRKPLLEVMDLVSTALPLGHAWGRLGCFLNGCCHGRVCEATIGAVRFPGGSLPWQRYPDGARSLPLIPTQLIEVFGNLAIFLVLYRLFPRRPFRGAIAGLYLLLYPLLRFLVEPLRGDLRPGLGSLSNGQWISLGLMVLGIGILLIGHRLFPILPESDKTTDKQCAKRTKP